MKYVNETVRRQDRLMDEAKALKLLENGEYGVLSMVSDGGGYGIPVNYVWNGKNSVYIHCAPEGRKLEALKDNNKVSLCIIGGGEFAAKQVYHRVRKCPLFRHGAYPA